MTTKELIAEGEELKASIKGTKLEHLNDYNIWHQKTLRFLNQTVPGDMVIAQFERAVNLFNPNYCHLGEFERILSILQAFEVLPERTTDSNPLKIKQNAGISINNSLNQSQNQSQKQEQQQDVIVKILFEAVKDELTGKQRKELLAIAEKERDTQETHKSIVAKLKGFGEDVAANIVANIMTNSQVWHNIGALL